MLSRSKRKRRRAWSYCLRGGRYGREGRGGRGEAREADIPDVLYGNAS